MSRSAPREAQLVRRWDQDLATTPGRAIAPLIPGWTPPIRGRHNNDLRARPAQGSHAPSLTDGFEVHGAVHEGCGQAPGRERMCATSSGRQTSPRASSVRRRRRSATAAGIRGFHPRAPSRMGLFVCFDVLVRSMQLVVKESTWVPATRRPFAMTRPRRTVRRPTGAQSAPRLRRTRCRRRSRESIAGACGACATRSCSW